MYSLEIEPFPFFANKRSEVLTGLCSLRVSDGTLEMLVSEWDVVFH